LIVIQMKLICRQVLLTTKNETMVELLLAVVGQELIWGK